MEAQLVAQRIIDVLRHDHDELRELFARLEAAKGKRKSDLFDRLVRDLVRHEVAEEEVLRPVSRRDNVGERIAEARMKEEHRAEVLLKELQGLDGASSQFDTKLKRLRRQVAAHAEAEENGANFLGGEPRDRQTARRAGQGLPGGQRGGAHAAASRHAQHTGGEHADRPGCRPAGSNSGRPPGRAQVDLTLAGRDWFDVCEWPSGQVAVAIGDVQLSGSRRADVAIPVTDLPSAGEPTTEATVTSPRWRDMIEG